MPGNAGIASFCYYLWRNNFRSTYTIYFRCITRLRNNFRGIITILMDCVWQVDCLISGTY